MPAAAERPSTLLRSGGVRTDDYLECFRNGIGPPGLPAGDEVLASIDVDSKSHASCGAPADDLGELSAWLYARRRGAIAFQRMGASRQSFGNRTPRHLKWRPGRPANGSPITRANAGVKPITGKGDERVLRSDGFGVQEVLIEPPSSAGKTLSSGCRGARRPASALPTLPARRIRLMRSSRARATSMFKPNPRGRLRTGRGLHTGQRQRTSATETCATFSAV